MENFKTVFRHTNEPSGVQNERKDICAIGLKIFVDEVVLEKEFLEKVNKVVVDSIERLRKCLSSDYQSIKNFNEFISKLSCSDEVNLYEKVFEQVYLQEAEKHYRTVANRKMVESTPYDYIIGFEGFLKGELALADRYAMKQTVKK